jgi:hypothetical protein
VFSQVSDGFSFKLLVKRVIQVVSWTLELHDFYCWRICADLITLVMSYGVDPA